MEELSRAAELLEVFHKHGQLLIDEHLAMLLVAFADVIENELAAAAEAEVLILECGDAVRLVVADAFLGADAKVKRIDQPHHHGQYLFARESVQSEMFVRDLSKLGEMLAKTLNLL